jgi:hypothetical protein
MGTFSFINTGGLVHEVTHRGKALDLEGNAHMEVDNDIAEDLEGNDNDNEDVDVMELDV